VHCGVRITAGDRPGLEQLCRYLLRPAFAEERLSRLSDGRILYRFRRPWPDGTSHVALDPVDFVGKLAALVSPPRSHTVRYHGVLGPHSNSRAEVVGSLSVELPDEEPQACRHPKGEREGERKERPKLKKPPRTDWATLLLRSMSLDALRCPRCEGRMKIIACLTDPPVVRKVLRAMGLRTEVPGAMPARPPPQSELDFETDQREGA